MERRAIDFKAVNCCVFSGGARTARVFLTALDALKVAAPSHSCDFLTRGSVGSWEALQQNERMRVFNASYPGAQSTECWELDRVGDKSKEANNCIV